MNDPHRLRRANYREQLAGEILRDYVTGRERTARRDQFISALREAGIDLEETITLDVQTLENILAAMEDGR